jgi:hypothetical protein
VSREERTAQAPPQRTIRELRRELLLLLGGAQISLDLRRLGLPPDQRRKLAAALAATSGK